MEVFVTSKIIIFVLSGMPSIASSKVTMTTILLQRKEGPWKQDIAKRKEQTAFYDRFQPLAGPGNKGKRLKLLILVFFRHHLKTKN